MNFALKLAIIVVTCLILFFAFSLSRSVDLGEELPATIEPENIIWGAIRAYHPDLFYKKYRLYFSVDSPIVEKPSSDVASTKIKDFYYYHNEGESTAFEKEILKDDSAQTYLKFTSKDKTYLITASGDHGGSANYRNIRVKLYKKSNEGYDLLLDKSELYSIDPGFDSKYFTDRLKLWIYKVIIRDERYL